MNALRFFSLLFDFLVVQFHCGFTDFEDVKYVSGDRASWLSVKPTLGLDFPNLPYLIDHVTGVRLTQSMAIFHYIASCASDPTLVTGAPELAAYVTMLANQAMDLRNSMVRERRKERVQVDARSRDCPGLALLRRKIRRRRPDLPGTLGGGGTNEK
jgi:hypothetical protein